MVNLTRKIKLPILYVQPFCWGLCTSAFYPEQGVWGGVGHLVSAKSQLLNIFSSASQVVSVAASQPHQPRLKAPVPLAESAAFQ